MGVFKYKDPETGEWSSIPAIVGPKGEKGEPGVHVGDKAPEDPNCLVWVAPDEYVNDCIPNPKTADVGQTIVVKAVDENGKPIEWEACELGKKTFILIKELTLEEDASVITVELPIDENYSGYELAIWANLYHSASNSVKQFTLRLNSSTGKRLGSGLQYGDKDRNGGNHFIINGKDYPWINVEYTKGNSQSNNPIMSNVVRQSNMGHRIGVCEMTKLVFVSATDLPFLAGGKIMFYGR